MKAAAPHHGVAEQHGRDVEGINPPRLARSRPEEGTEHSRPAGSNSSAATILERPLKEQRDDRRRTRPPSSTVMYGAIPRLAPVRAMRESICSAPVPGNHVSPANRKATYSNPRSRANSTPR